MEETKIDAARFSELCEGRFTPEGEPGTDVTQQMIDAVYLRELTADNALRLANMFSIAWDSEPVIAKIESMIGTAPIYQSDRAIQAVLTAAYNLRKQ